VPFILSIGEIGIPSPKRIDMELLPVAAENEHKYLMRNLPMLLHNELLHISQHYGIYEGKMVRLRRTQTDKSSAIKYEVIHKEKVAKGQNIEHTVMIGMPPQDFIDDFLKRAERSIRKTRYVYYLADGLKFEADVFSDIHLIVGELEVADLSAPVDLPEQINDQIIAEVTYMEGFSNYDLARPIK